MKHLNAVILAGGSGTRLWPLSTPSFPKQFLPLPSGHSMIQETLARVADLASPAQSWVVTGRSMADLVQEHLPSISATHILREPMGRNSAPAIAWAAATVARQDPDAIMAIFSADAVITEVDALHQTLKLGYQLAEQGKLVTIGINPTSPETGYGYIRYAQKISEGFGYQAYQVERFVEKPNLATAQSYLDDGHYVWNAGIFIWSVKTILAELNEHLPEMAHTLHQIVNSNDPNTLEALWPTLQSISIDYGILEKSHNLTVIPAHLGWNDVGNWEQYGALFPSDEQGIRAVGEHTGFGSQNVIIYNNTSRRVYTVGLEDVVVVEMEDMTVICHKTQVQRVKELSEHHHKQPKQI
ncbi:mannose-1-phosphate guanylyltransferase [Tengunoibacter tsumagoiensis]|uniref:mannose-1-phosphate guanylyltransferase n=1 Tax=Tengunoibacter tsumagoiensis TaxID=2014871 RepID=A0A402A0F4_9CHLR|nr:sugar phosphate nucleotidyltransferase [Tengunoibacter tsumagoiensis]GCE12593.1 mannose-1-phosphate guanylyltransferase [Tengunoibacter tsumagoiensis]